MAFRGIFGFDVAEKSQKKVSRVQRQIRVRPIYMDGFTFSNFESFSLHFRWAIFRCVGVFCVFRWP